MGTNQPNRFSDAKSAEGGWPHFSTGARSDIVQQRFLLAHLDHWSDAANNPVSGLYGGPMVDTGAIFLWSWDARPFPEFPQDQQRWSDGANWHTGHWLNGRIGGCPLDDLLAAIAADFGLDAEIDCDGFVDGYVITEPSSARDALQPLAELFGVVLREDGGALRLEGPASRGTVHTVEAEHFVAAGEDPLVARRRDRDIDLPSELVLRHSGIFSAYEAEQSYSRRLEAGHGNQAVSSLPAVLPKSMAVGALEAALRRAWTGRERARIALTRRYLHLEPGDLLEFGDDRLPGLWFIDSIEDSRFRRLELRAAGQFETLPARGAASIRPSGGAAIFGAPECWLMNLPIDPAGEGNAVYCAVDAEPWAGRYALWSSPGADGFQHRRTVRERAVAGSLLNDLSPGPEGRWDPRVLEISLGSGELESLPDEQVLNGANALAVFAANGEWEILQFARAELLPGGIWRLSRLLRAQMGTDPAMLAGAAAGSPAVLLDEGVARIDLSVLENSLELNWRIGPAVHPVSAETCVARTHRHVPLAARPLSPVHLGGERVAGGDVALSWIRRSRIEADLWDAPEIPLGEAGEAYSVDISAPGGPVLRSIEAGAPWAVYAAADQHADFGELPQSLQLRVAQLSGSGTAGAARTEILHFTTAI